MSWERFTRLANDWRAYRATRHAATADPEQPRTLPHPCPCCGGRMIIIETFEHGYPPRTRPTGSIWIDTS
jgi:hypothetical protein